MKAKKIIILLTLLLAAALSAQQADPGILTIDRIYNSKEFNGDWFGPARWLMHRGGYTTLEQSKDVKHGRDIVLYSVRGRRSVMVSAKNLIPKDKDKPLTIANYIWSKDGSKLLIFTNTKRVWRRNTRGDYWVYNLKTKELFKLGGEHAKPSTLMFAKFSPDGARTAYVRENNIYVENLTTHKITQLTSDGSKTIINGTSDWVYEEEFGLRDGFRWSPDGKYIAFWQFDASGVGVFYMINNTDSIYSKIIPVQYPKAGTTNSACRVGVVQSDGGPVVWMKVKGYPRNLYIAKMEWIPDSHKILFQKLNRLQNQNQVTEGDAETGDIRTIITDRDSAWVDVNEHIVWLDNGKSFTWVSEKDGWRHVYIVSLSTGRMNLVTKGDYDVIRVEKVDPEGGQLYFSASLNNAFNRYLFKTNLDGTGNAQRLTPLKEAGTHYYQISPDSKWAIHTYSAFENPTVIDLVRLKDHKRIRTLVDNHKLREKFNILKRRTVEFSSLKTDYGVKLDYWMMKPYNFNPVKKYPVLFYVYGEPAAQTVLNRWGGKSYLWYLMLTQQGYIVISVDNRGTPAPKGRSWRKCIYKRVGVIASKDQAAACRIVRSWSFVDSTRIGIWGWSGGGSMTLNMMFRYPGLYKAGMAVAPVANQKLYDTIYQERYMGLPQQNPEEYKMGSPITFAKNLKGDLLVVHGTGDDNVHYQNTEMLINELIKNNKQFSVMVYPNRSHGIYEGKNTTRHLRTLLTNYLNRHIFPGSVK
ncbi:S9 family peptidase [bacterium]|nr:S9 family peptidase [bacterium]